MKRLLKLGFWLWMLGFFFFAGSFLAGQVQQKPPLKKPPFQLPPQLKEFKMTIDNIMRGDELLGSPPSNVMWSYDGKMVYFRWKKPEEKEADFYAYSKGENFPRKIKLEDMLKVPPLPPQTSLRFFRFGPMGMDIHYDREKRRALVVQAGDILLIDLKTGKTTQLTQTDGREAYVSFSFDQKKVVFSLEDNLYLLSLEDGSLRQMTSFTRRKPPEEKKPGEIDKWYSDQQLELFQALKKSRERMGRTERREMFSSFMTAPTQRRKPFYLEENQQLLRLDLSPDENYVLFIISENVTETKETIVPNYVTESGFTETIPSHPKAAYSSEMESRAGIMTVSNGDVKWVDYEQADRKVFQSFFIWSPDGKTCLLTAHSEDRKDQWLFRLDWTTGKTTAIEHVHDDAWVDDLGLTNIFWSLDSQRIFYVSEKGGFAHLYSASPDGKNIQQLTSGSFEVSAARLSFDGKKIYLTSNEEHPGERHFYVMGVGGGTRTKITSMVGRNEAFLSPDETALAILFSSGNRPPEVYWQENKPGVEARQLTLTTSDEFRGYSWYDPEVINFKARDGATVYARFYPALNWHPSKPAVIFIHGAGYLQNAHKGWSRYSREYMFHNFLMEKGYLVLDVDYRGSAGYGRDCRTAIYRHMGGKDLDDIADAAKFLAEKYKANPEKIGIYGGSYGGFLTLMGMFKYPDVFKAGAALRPVTDWAHYQPSYTVDILNTPQKDTEAYKQSSPIYFAEGLKGALLICHGMVDTNVHFQDTVRLVQRLIELGKENWEVAIYPVENHEFQNASSWADEYKRIFKLFEANLK